MKTAQLIFMTIAGLLALVLFLLALLADGLAWIFDFLGDHLKRAAVWLIGE